MRLASSSFNACAVAIRKSRHWNSALCSAWLTDDARSCGVQSDVAFQLQRVQALAIMYNHRKIYRLGLGSTISVFGTDTPIHQREREREREREKERERVRERERERHTG